MIESLLFVLFMTLVVVISMAIPTLHLEHTEITGAGGGRPRTRLQWNQVNISPYRGIWMFAWILSLVLYFTGGQITLPPISRESIHRVTVSRGAVSGGSGQPAPAATQKPATEKQPEAEATKPVAPVAPPSPPPPASKEKGVDMDQLRGRTPDYLKDDPIL